MQSNQPYQNYKIYGPYLNRENRLHIIAISPDGKRKTVPYPRYLVELREGRYQR